MVARREMDRHRRKRQKRAGPVSHIRRWHDSRTHRFRTGTPSRVVAQRQPDYLWKTARPVGAAGGGASERRTHRASANPVAGGGAAVSIQAGWEGPRLHVRTAGPGFLAARFNDHENQTACAPGPPSGDDDL